MTAHTFVETVIGGTLLSGGGLLLLILKDKLNRSRPTASKPYRPRGNFTHRTVRA